MKKRGRYLSFRVSLAAAGAAVLLAGLTGLVWVAALRGLLPWSTAAAVLVLTGVLPLAGWHWIYRPFRDMERLCTLFAAGYTFDGMYEADNQVSPGVEMAILHMRDLLSREDILNASKRQAQYLALQNQINPHFLYNTLEGIRGEALAGGSESIAMMTEALSTFFRYTISKLENLVLLEDELANVENYFLIQQYRFGSRISLSVEFESREDRRALLGCRLPKLTLQPIVENAIVHGLEGKIGSGHVVLRIVGTGQRVIITVKDDGVGMDSATLDALRHRLNLPFSEGGRAEGKGGIAIVNVNHRIHLLFGESYGLSVYSASGQGTDVEVNLPLRQDAEESVNAV